MEEAPASTAPDATLAKARRQARTSCRNASATVGLDDHSRTFNTELVAALELAYMLDVAEASSRQRAAARGVARRAPAHRLPGARRRALPDALAGATATPTGRRGSTYLPVTITRWPPGRAGLREVSRRWPSSITLAGDRPLPARSRTTRAALPGRTRCRCRKDWAVLDGAQLHQGPARRHAVLPLVVPDGHLRQLRHDGQRRAEADLRDVPDATTRPARSASSRCANFPVIRDLVVDLDDFMHKLTRGQAVDHPRRGASRSSEGEYLQTPAQLDDYKQFSMCINCMLCYAACPVYGLDGTIHRPGGDRAGAALQPRLPRRGRPRAARRPGAADGVWDCTFVGECTRAARSTSTRPARSSGYKLTAALESVKAFLLPWRSR